MSTTTRTTSSIPLHYRRAAVLEGFSGVSENKVTAALVVLETACKRGHWLPEDKARSVRAALNKSNEVARLVRKFKLKWEDYRDNEGLQEMNYAAYGVEHVAKQGTAEIDRLEAEALKADAKYHHAARFVFAVARAMAPVVEALDALDATRPPPRISPMGAVNPSHRAVLADLGFKFDGERAEDGYIEVCPSEIVWIEETDTDGKKFRRAVVRLLWPEGTHHGGSRHHDRLHDGRACACEACGHPIRNPYNWVPFVVRASARATPWSLWVGRDCAKRLFQVEVDGELEIEGR